MQDADKLGFTSNRMVWCMSLFNIEILQQNNMWSVFVCVCVCGGGEGGQQKGRERDRECMSVHQYYMIEVGC